MLLYPRLSAIGKKYVLPLIGTITAMCLAVPALAANHIETAYATNHVASIRTVDKGAIKVDGDLSEWGFGSGATFIDGMLDNNSGPVVASKKIGTAFKLAHDSEALYIAVYVVDPSVVPNKGTIWEKDGVELFLDIRPVENGKDPKLGDSAYSNGVYQILAANPLDSDYVRVEYGSNPTKLGAYQIQGKVLDNGYTLELRIPFTSLYQVNAERFNKPFGFEIQVDEADAIPGKTATTERYSYSWSGTNMQWQDASSFCIIDPAFKGDMSARPVAAQFKDASLQIGDKSLGSHFIGGVVTTGQSHSDLPMIYVQYTKLEPGKEGKPGNLHGEKKEVVTYEPFGVSVYRHWWPAPKFVSGNYRIQSIFPDLKLMQTVKFGVVNVKNENAAKGEPFQQGVIYPGLKTGDSLVLHSGWKISPAGKAISLPGDMSQCFVPTPDGKYLLTNTGGYHDHGISVIDLKTNQVIQSIPISQTFGNICFNPQGTMLYVTAGHAKKVEDPVTKAAKYKDAILTYAWANGKLTPGKNIDLTGASDNDCFITGLAVSPAGDLYAVNIDGNSIYRLEANGGQYKIAAYQHLPFRPFACVLSPDQQSIAVCNWGDESVTFLNSNTLAEIGSCRTGSHPNALVFAKDGRLFIANGGSNTVSVLQNGQFVETIRTSLHPNELIGSTPVALALSPDQKRLYVADAGNNDVAVVDISESDESKVIGFIPTGWYPCALSSSIDGSQLYVGVGKGMHFSANADKTYIGNLLNGAVSVVDVPDAKQLAKYTGQVIENVPSLRRTYKGSVDKKSIDSIEKTLHSIKHVVYIIRENRTYDQVLGDIGKGNSDPSITMFGEDVTPNAHKLANEYVLLDNLYCDGEVSESGHEWCNAAYATDFNERAWTNSYGGRDEPLSDERLMNSPAGYFWDNCERHGLTYRSYGEFASFTSNPNSPPVFSGTGTLKGHCNTAYGLSVWNKRDTVLSKIFIDDLKAAEKSGNWPNYMVMSLPEDHTRGTTAGAYTPVAAVASNDQALGQIVEAVSHSKFWKDTAIFVIEDDAQNGPDHVDAHRTVGLVISPYVKRGVVDSTHYTTASMVRTMEIILGLPPMTQFDANATPMYNTFSIQANAIAYNNLAPKVDLEAKNQSGPAAVESEKLDFSTYDKADPGTLNRILWQALKPGQPMPAPVRGVIVNVLNHDYPTSRLKPPFSPNREDQSVIDGHDTIKGR